MAKDVYYEPLYKVKVKPSTFEKEIIKTYWFQRLKYIHHTGVDFTFSYRIHTRYQHSLGVYSLATLFYPKNELIRLSALLHDIGHLPFSHAVEDAYKSTKNKSIHHKFTKNILFKTEISDILRSRGIPPRAVYDIIEGNYNSPLKPRNNILGMDLFDCFVRDMYYSGMRFSPSRLIKKINVADNGINTDAATGKNINRLIINDHKLMYSKESIIRSALAQRLFSLVLSMSGYDKDEMFRYSEYEVINKINKLSNRSKRIKKILSILLYSETLRDKIDIKFIPNRIESDNMGDEIKYAVKKVYAKDVLVNGTPLSAIDKDVNASLLKLNKYIGTYIIPLHNLL
ncbi:HD domain-containing protein [Candidatus Micrarchaeota archaeon]|nr:HD domain-containing protein [Candidatus Micrarchaeota archaeon]